MSLLQRVVKSMDKIAPLKLAEQSWDNVGVLLEAPFPRPNAHRVFLTIDLTQPVLDEALQDPKVGVIVSYHPPIFKAMKRLCLSDEKQAIALKCAAAGVSIYSPHTSLDNCVGGINDWLARGLGAGRTIVMNPADNAPPEHEGAGSGRIHTLNEPVPLEEIVRRVKAHLVLSHVRVATARTSKPISTIAICAGSGASVLGGVKADLYLTGEMSHHEVLAAVASDANVILCEHSNSERGYLADVLRSRLQSSLRIDHGLDAQPDMEVEVVISDVDADPLKVM
ncbi:hypothetical protein HK097_002331 [Rhizophlyctis rosea]|uniref:NIF3-like protein 1 n=1 Tax=Rhizophlyctis rosea TaxID=64517 RepID=A0AAD5SKE4_9FUNG|nr:hypothetical protein HK097_002331 [Rhizophlyctis rosea]